MEPGRGPAQVVLLAGPSGAGKSRLARRTGLPVLHLDDFYRDGDDPALPRDAATGRPDWDDPRSWDAERAVATLERLCRDGAADVPVYDISADGTTGTRRLDLAGSRYVVGEGIFAAEIAPACRERGLLAVALCVRHGRLLTAWRRLVRDVAERRKPVPVLLRRGLALLRAEPRIVARHVALGAESVTAAEGARIIAALVAPTGSPGAAG